MELTKNPLQSWGIKTFARSRASKPLVRSFTKVYNINLDESARNLEDFENLQSLFIRKLDPSARTVDPATKSIVSPVDGTLSEVGEIQSDATFTIKGQTYDVSELVGLEKTSARYLGGTYMLFYLSPTDYHRIHSPVNGRIRKTWALGKHSSPVNPLGLALGDRVLAKNYRLLTEMKTKQDKCVCIVKIGALNVNSIHTSTALENEHLDKGEELAYFSFGSSVILLFEKGSIELNSSSRADGKVQHGSPIGKIPESLMKN